MTLHLLRRPAEGEAVFGDLFVGDLRLYTLESAKDAFGYGEWFVTTTHSPRVASKELWSPWPPYLPLINVPGRDGLMFHAGNTVGDTAGCPLVGMERVGTKVGISRVALTALMEELGFKRHVLIVRAW